MLPQPKDQQELEALDRTSDVFAQAARSVFARQVGTLDVKPTATGSCPVFMIGDAYVAKLFAPFNATQFATERAVLQLLSEAPGVPAPRLVATGEVNGWGALLMTRLDGSSLEQMWPALDQHERERLCRSLGRIVCALHRVDPSPLRAVSLDFDVFLAEQMRGCVDNQIRRGLSKELARQIPSFFASLNLTTTKPHVLLHTEIMLAHVFAAPTCSITGLIDFEPAMVGDAEYELASVGLFVARGDARLLGAFLDGYGKAPDPQLHRRIMAFTLLHRYSRLTWYLQFMPPGDSPRDSIEELAERWFRAS